MSKIKILSEDSDFGRAVKERRLERGIKQGQLAEVIDVNRTSIVELERATVTPRLDTMRKVAEALGYRIALVPLEAIPFVESYQPVDTNEVEWSEIDDHGIDGLTDGPGE